MATLVIWHGYLLGGTGSNIYSRELVEAWTRAGHDVILMCQEPYPHEHSAIEELIEVLDGTPRRRVSLRQSNERPGRCVMVRPRVGDLLPVFLVDRYEGFARVERFVDADPGDIAVWQRANELAMQWVLDEWSVDGVLINHVVMGPPTLRPILEHANVPYAVKVHGSELEYCINADVVEGHASEAQWDGPSHEGRFHGPGRAGLAGAVAVLVGSDHIARRTVELLGAECVGERIVVAPPGVDVERFAPLTRSREEGIAQLAERVTALEGPAGGRPPTAQADVEALASSYANTWPSLVSTLTALATTYDDRQVELGAGAALAGLSPTAPIVTFVGKLIQQKGVHLVLAAWPLVLAEHPHAQLVIAGFGKLREGLAALTVALAHGQWDLVRDLAAKGGQIDDGGADELAWLAPFVDRLEKDEHMNARYAAAAQQLVSSTTHLGLVGHEVLELLWPLATVSLVPSVAAEAFGMVAAEAASSGAIPVVARHSGLADVAAALADDLSEAHSELLSFPLGLDAVTELAGRIIAILDLAQVERGGLSSALRAAVCTRWSWAAVAQDAVVHMTGRQQAVGSQ